MFPLGGRGQRAWGMGERRVHSKAEAWEKHTYFPNACPWPKLNTQRSKYKSIWNTESGCAPWRRAKSAMVDD